MLTAMHCAIKRARRALMCLLFVCVCHAAGAYAGAGEAVTVTDVAGRRVFVRIPPARIVLGDGAFAYALPLVRPESPFSGVVAWGDNVRTGDMNLYAQYLRHYPEMAGIKTFSGKTSESINSETAISLAPDVIFLNLGAKSSVESSGFMEKMDLAGIPVIFLDFRSPMSANTADSMRILGRIFACPERVNAFLQFRQDQIRSVTEPLQSLRARPLVMVERAAGFDAGRYMSYGNANLGELVAAAGGENLGSRFIYGTFGVLHPEQMIACNPDAVLLTGAGWSLSAPSGGWVDLGPGADVNKGRAQLENLLRRPAYRASDAARNGKAYALWHGFYDSPYAFIALQQIAKWLHPEVFAALDPEETFRQLHQRFLPVPYQSGYWVALEPAP
ncbi:ABC transporter substrate-binding protein [Desulfovibrio sp.]|uniref:ABC transporter substrate-binding protein n=1 Tax=Desulfovibrio sp. TaxID=885 RepID=UPI0025B93AD4|nr:ABC transporter substrate-binding protein [Desulfovibrio sp.]